MSRELELKSEGTDYAYITKKLGSGYLECTLSNKKKIIGNINGNLNKRVWMQIGDLVLVSFRDYQDSKCDILLKYFPHEIKQLIKLGHVTSFNL